MPDEDVWSACQRLAAEDPAACAVDDGQGGRLDRRALLSRADELARDLATLGAPTVALLADNGPAWAVADLASLRAGVTLVPLPPFFSDEQRRWALGACGAAGVLTDDPARLPGHGGALRLGDLWWLPLGGTGAHPGIARITFSSGSTGAPKGVRLTAATLLDVARSLQHVTAMDATDVHLCLLPLAVLLENVAGLHRALLAGARCVLPPVESSGSDGTSAADGARIDAALRRHGATSVVLVPGVLDALVSFLEASGRRAPPSCRFLGVGGAAVPGHLLDRAEALGLPVHEGYGLSEAGSVVCLSTPAARRRGSVGRPLPHVRLHVSPDGELVLDAPPFAGYVGQPPPASDAPQGFPTGDLGSVDDDGFVSITGRRKALFITSFGRNLSPEWIERHLLDERCVLQAAVFGEGLPGPVAVIVPRRGSAPDELAAAVARVDARLPVWARLRRWTTAAPFTVANGRWAATGGPRRAAIAADHPGLLSAPTDSPTVAVLSPGTSPS